MSKTGCLNRRETLVTIASGAAMAATFSSGGQAKDLKDRAVVEWTQHMFSSDLARFPINPKYLAYRPKGEGARSPGGDQDTNADRAARMASRYPTDPLPPYLARLQSDGIGCAVFVAPEPYGDDPALVLDCLRRTPSDRFKATSLFYPREAGAPAKLAALVKREPRIISTRFHRMEGSMRYFNSFAEPGVRALWKQAVDLDLVIELHIGPQFGRQVADVITAFPGSKVLIDHLAEPQTGSAIDYASILDLAKFPNVYMKVSELASMAKDPPLFASLLPLTRRVIKEFGPDRMVWSGGNLHLAEVHFEGYSSSDMTKVCGGNLRRLSNW